MLVKNIVNIVVFICLFNVAIDAQYNCVMVNPLPVKRNLNFIVSNGSRYVAGGNGVLLTSHNGSNWTAIDSINSSHIFTAAVWTGTQFVAIGGDGLVMTSIDGLNWNTTLNKTINSAKSITWTGSKLVVVEDRLYGFNTSISSDGINWTNYKEEDLFYDMQSVTWTGSRLYAAGDGIVTSVDGINWTSVRMEVGESFSSITWTGNKLIATCNKTGIGMVLTSLDGQEWTVDTISEDNHLYSVVSNGSQIIVGAAQSIFTSSDGNTWNEWELVNSRESINYVNKIGNRYFAVGNNGTMYTSEDGITWSNRPATTLLSVIWTGELFVAAGVNTILTSPDGYIWTERFESVYQIESMAGQGSRLAAVGFEGRIYSSSDGGITWAKQLDTELLWLNSVTWTGSMFVAVGSDGTVLTSPDGVDWTIRPTGISTTLTSITWTGSKLVATGFDEDVILTSKDGISWAKHIGPRLNYVNWTGSKLLGKGTNSFYFSEDGENWTMQDVNWTIGTVNSIIWTGKDYITAGVIEGKPAICVSYNVYVWRNMVQVPLNSFGTLQSIATNGKTIVAVGDTGLIFTCEPESGSADKISPPHFYRQTLAKITIDKKGKNRLEARIPEPFTKKNLSFQIYSITGKLLRSIKADGPLVHIPTLGFSPGRYFLTVEWQGGKLTHPFVIDR